MKKKDNENKVDWKSINAKYKIIPIRFNKKEHERFEILFNNSEEKQASTFIKKCIYFGGSNYKDVENKYNELEELYKKYIDNLRRIGININQISMKINFIDTISDDDKKLLTESLGGLKREIFDYKKRAKLHQEKI